MVAAACEQGRVLTPGTVASGAAPLTRILTASPRLTTVDAFGSVMRTVASVPLPSKTRRQPSLRSRTLVRAAWKSMPASSGRAKVSPGGGGVVVAERLGFGVAVGVTAGVASTVGMGGRSG